MGRTRRHAYRSRFTVDHLVITAGAILAAWTALAIPAGILIGRRLRRLTRPSPAPPHPAAAAPAPRANKPPTTLPATDPEPKYEATT